MSDDEQNLHVLTDHIRHLAGKHHTASDKIMGANRSTGDVAGLVTSTHGIVCSATSLAVSAADAARKTAGAALFRVSTEFEEKLTTAAANYENTDYLNGTDLGGACSV